MHNKTSAVEAIQMDDIGPIDHHGVKDAGTAADVNDMQRMGKIQELKVTAWP
jgi:hypothetical protein